MASSLPLQPRWAPAEASVMSAPCASAATGGKNGLQGGAGSFRAGGFKLFPGHPEMSSVLIHYSAASL